MSGMVERVARALVAFQQLPESAWVDHVDMARAAIEAMREPTQAMVEVGEPYAIEYSDFAGGWRLAIDEALRPKLDEPRG